RLNDSGQSSTRRIMRLRFLLWRFVMSPRCFISRFLFIVQLWYQNWWTPVMEQKHYPQNPADHFQMS
ncbi:hypothetical protein NXZ52_30635, partial [Escherichia coli]|nr:hypothetical protein [Escherichia coli]